ncbi:MAG: cytochrome b5 domain-containing protein [Nanoarchaeota archaeon]
MKKKYLILLLFSFILLFFGCNQQDESLNVDNSLTTLTTINPSDTTNNKISQEEFKKHNSKQDCWIVYEGNVYDYTDAPRHPNMDKVFFTHCGELNGFEEGAKSKHSSSNEVKVANFGTKVGVLE